VRCRRRRAGAGAEADILDLQVALEWEVKEQVSVDLPATLAGSILEVAHEPERLLVEQLEHVAQRPPSATSMAISSWFVSSFINFTVPAET